MMRLLRIVITVLFVAAAVLFARDWYHSEIKADKTLPVITIEGDMLEVDFNATDEDLLMGVTAYDEKDGDLTGRVIVESISKFTEIGVCKVYYAVCDNDNHVASASRKITYRGYTSPQFTLNRALCFSQLEAINTADIIGATDVLDGDISSSIILTSSDYEYGVVGKYSVKAEVSNSKGDQISLTFPMIVEDRNINAPNIELSRYLMYVPLGTPIDPAAYFVSARDSYEIDVSGTLYMENNYQQNQEGIYSFHYYATDSLGRVGHSILLVVVE
ncbi:MAG: hypothetical protein IJK98_05605 [Clostridia bacterium]|nr:hypothetical protein [Clostridia bacterium]